MTAEDEKSLWAEAIIVFDSSALLNLYSYSEETRQKLFTEVFPKLADRLWIPNHVLFEYDKNRESVIRKPIAESYQALKDDHLSPIMKSSESIVAQLTQIKSKIKNTNKHPFFDPSCVQEFEQTLKDALKKFQEELKNNIEDRIKEIEAFAKNDTVLKAIKTHFKTSDPTSFTDIVKLIDEGRKRYDHSIPPGYKDEEGKDAKIGTQIFGDLILWKQILSFSEINRKPVLFICDDLKQDWWDDSGKKEIARHELIKEFFDLVKERFWMYNLGDFLFKANELLNSKISREEIIAVSEATDPRKELMVIVPLNNRWDLNHWGCNYATLKEDKIIFQGETGNEDGCNTDLLGALKQGDEYEVTCFAKSSPGTTGQFRLWCHNHFGDERGFSGATDFRTPSENGETFRMTFKATINSNIRIHLQYIPGKGTIEVSNVRIYRVTPL